MKNYLIDNIGILAIFLSCGICIIYSLIKITEDTENFILWLLASIFFIIGIIKLLKLAK